MRRVARQRRRLAEQALARVRGVRIDDRGRARELGARRGDRRDRPEQHAELAARDQLGVAADRLLRRRRGGAAGEPAEAVAVDVGRDLDLVGRRTDERAHVRARDRATVAVEHAAFDRAAAHERELGHAAPRLELDAAGRDEAGRERIRDPAAVRHALDAEHAVVAAARRSAAPGRRRMGAARPPRPSRRPRRGRRPCRRRSRAASSAQLERRERPGAEPVHAHAARRESRLATRTPDSGLPAGSARGTRRARRSVTSSVPPIASPRMPTLRARDRRRRRR